MCKAHPPLSFPPHHHHAQLSLSRLSSLKALHGTVAETAPNVTFFVWPQTPSILTAKL